jgi:hypothetical protein
MNAKCCLISTALVLALFVLNACSGSMDKQILELNALKQISDSVNADLKTVDTLEVAALLEQSSAIKEQFKLNVKNDTLELDFAEHLNVYLQANQLLTNLTNEYTLCHQANKQAAERVIALKTDIENGSGERANYAKFVQQETKEIRSIRSHCIDIKRSFDQSKLAIEQFQPEIERFMNQFVVSSIVP